MKCVSGEALDERGCDRGPGDSVQSAGQLCGRAGNNGAWLICTRPAFLAVAIFILRLIGDKSVSKGGFQAPKSCVIVAAAVAKDSPPQTSGLSHKRLHLYVRSEKLRISLIYLWIEVISRNSDRKSF